MRSSGEKVVCREAGAVGGSGFCRPGSPAVIASACLPPLPRPPVPLPPLRRPPLLPSLSLILLVIRLAPWGVSCGVNVHSASRPFSAWCGVAFLVLVVLVLAGFVRTFWAGVEVRGCGCGVGLGFGCGRGLR